jgi:hypothetical protein
MSAERRALVRLVPLVLAALGAEGCTKSCAGVDAPPGGGLGSPPPPAAVRAAPPPAGSVVFSAGGDAVEPAITALGEDFFVGWVDGGRVAMSTERAAKEGRAAYRPDGAEASWGIALASLPAAAAGVWLDERPARGIRLQIFNVDGAPRGPIVTLSSAAGAGPPAVIGVDRGFIALWVEPPRVRAVKIGEDGKILAESSWPGGNLRPWSRFSGPKPPNAPADRAAPFGVGSSVSLVKRADGVHAFWWGGHWHSDDLGGNAHYERIVRFPDDGSEPQPLVGALPVWASLEAIGDTASVQAFHNPNGGPWELSIRAAGSKEAAPPFTSEPAGPLEPVIERVGNGHVIAWPSPTFGGVAVASVDESGSVKDPISVLSSGAGFGDAGAAIAAGKGGTRIAWVDSNDAGGTVIRTTSPEKASAASAAKRSMKDVEVTPWNLKERRSSIEDYDVALAPSGEVKLLTLATRWGTDSDTAEVLVYGLDQNGLLGKTPAVFAPYGPRCDAGAAIRFAGDVLVAYSCCNDRSICSKADVRVAASRAGAATAVTPAEPMYQMPVLAAKGEDVALVMMRGEYSSRRIVVRFAAGKATEVAARLVGARDIEVPAWDGDSVGAPAAAFVEGGLLVAFHDKRPSATSRETTDTRVFLVERSGTMKEGVVLTEPGYGVWGEHRMVSVPGGAAILGKELENGQPQAILWHISADGASVQKKTRLARRATMQAPYVAISEDGATIGAAFYDARTDGDWVGFVRASDGAKLGPILRVDRPEKRASRDDPKIIAEKGAWRVFWKEPDGVFSVAMP